MNTAVTPDNTAGFGADVIIAALGAVPAIPPIPGIDSGNVFSAETVYEHPELAGDRVVILGAGLVGLELSIYLSMLGKKVSVIEMLEELNDGGNYQHMKGVRVQLDKYGIDVSLSTRATEITKDGVLCRKGSDTSLFLADTVVYAVGQKALYQEARALYQCAPEFYLLGDCVAPSNIKNATKTAYAAARNIGRI